MNCRLRARQKGYVLLAALLALMVMSGLAVGLCYLVNTETKVGYSDEANSVAYYSAEAALEKLTADLRDLYNKKREPTSDEIKKLVNSVPSLGNGVKLEESVGFEDGNGNLVDTPTTAKGEVAGGDFAGLKAKTVRLLATVTATITSTGQQVQISRDIEVALIPVFQFGAFSDEDLSYFPGETFHVGGRVHTNGNLFLASAANDPGLIFHDHVSSSKQIIRAQLANGVDTASSKGNPVRVASKNGGCGAETGTTKPDDTTCPILQNNEGSTVGGPSASLNQQWTSIVSRFKSFLLATVKELKLSFVAEDVAPIELIRRPNPNKTDSEYLAASRMYNIAQIRVLIDNADASGLSGYTTITGVPNTAIKVEVRTSEDENSWKTVTSEWLGRGITQPGTKAPATPPILRFTKNDGKTPINLYDVREGEPRELNSTDQVCTYAGTMNTVELDVGALKSWLASGGTGPSVNYTKENGYVMYFSDQRGALANTDVPSTHPDYGRKAGYGFTDVTNIKVPDGTPNGKLDPGEYLNRLPGYSETDPLGFEAASIVGKGMGASQNPLTYGVKNLADPKGSLKNPYTAVSCSTAKSTWVTGARHALKLVNGKLGNLPEKPDGTGGFTVVSENPVYVQGNYNADALAFQDSGHAAAAIIADAVTLLSASWIDSTSFDYPRKSTNNRKASPTYYRMAIAAGTSLAFKKSDGYSGSTTDFGLDGGVHNFLRYLEDWGSIDSFYRGSIVVLFPSQYATGTYKNGSDMVYKPPKRNYSFDSDFLEWGGLPPGTPQVKDVINLGFRQNFKPR